jgi:hypothetical protein
MAAIIILCIMAGCTLLVIGQLVRWSYRHCRKTRCQHERISLLVPFKGDDGVRSANWDWLRRYWAHELPGAEIVMGRDSGTPFCKTAAVNDADKRAHGDVFVILDADCYITGEQVQAAADAIRAARKRNERLWLIPYRKLFRLTGLASCQVRLSNPADPLRFSVPPPQGCVEGTHASGHGHWYAAMIQIMPREAFEAVGGMDERFRGWGGEDVSFMFALDTLWGKHKTLPGQVLHLWHPTISGDWKFTRQWEGQDHAEQNDWLSGKYERAFGDVAAMRSLQKGKGNLA